MNTVEQVLDAKSWWRKGSSGSDLSLRSDKLDSVSELYTEDDLRQLVVALEATRRANECGLVLETSPWSGGHRRE